MKSTLDATEINKLRKTVKVMISNLIQNLLERSLKVLSGPGQERAWS